MTLTRLSLRLAVPLLLLVVGLGVAALFVTIELRQTRERAITSAIAQVGTIGGIMIEDIEKAMRRGQPVRETDLFRPVRSSRTIREAVLIDHQDRVLYATTPGAEDRILARTSYVEDSSIVEGARATKKPLFRITPGDSELVLAHPFAMPPLTGELLPSRTGVLLLHYELALPLSAALGDARTRTTTVLLLLGLLCLVVSWAFGRSFTPRIDALVEATEKIAAGEFDTIPRVGGADEVARLGRAIARMADRLEKNRSELLESKAELEGLNSELEDRVRVRTAESAAHARDMESFAYTISHDLRAPLRSIAGFAQVLQQDYASSLDREAGEHIDRILQNSFRMSRLINDILTFSRRGRQPLSTAVVDLSALARKAADELLAEHPEPNRVDLRIDEVPMAVADGNLMYQVLHNLVSNAIKYSEPRETIRIHFGAEQSDEGAVYFLADNGIGFEMEYADKIFAPFQRLHAPDEFEGSGVGLAIVERILERHGGFIEVESQPGVGTTFRFGFFRPAAARERGRRGPADVETSGDDSSETGRAAVAG